MVDQTQEQKTYPRFSSVQRFEHVVIIVTFVGLAITGLPQRYADQSWAMDLIDILGGVESVRIIHRVLASILIAESIFHGGVICYKLYVLRQQATMMPSFRDLQDMVQWFAYNLGLRAEHPHMPRYNFGEKAEYWALVWGTLIMIATGFILWNPITFARLLPGQIIPAARAAHSGEALLAVLAIIVWHMYTVHFKHFNRSMFTGNMSHEEMSEEHAEELAEIEGQEKALEPWEQVEPDTGWRERLYWIYAFIGSTLLISGLVWLITVENSAISTVPRNEEVVIFAPQVEIESGDAAVGRALWSTLRCSFCHGEDALGSADAPALLGVTELTFTEFVLQLRQQDGEMPPFSVEELPDAYLLHLWTWLTSG